MRWPWLVSICVCSFLGAPTAVHGHQIRETSFAVGIIYRRALGGEGGGEYLHLGVPVPVTVLGGDAVLGLRGEVTAVGGGPATTLASVGVRPRMEWRFLVDRVRPHVSIPLQLLYAGHDTMLVCYPSPGPSECLAGGDRGLAAGIEAGVAVEIVGRLDFVVSGSALWNNVDMRRGGALRTVDVGIALQW